MRRRGWKLYEEELLIKHYKTSTIQELQKFFPSRSADSINAKIKRLKAENKIDCQKDQDAVNRALRQRGKDEEETQI